MSPIFLHCHWPRSTVCFHRGHAALIGESNWAKFDSTSMALSPSRKYYSVSQTDISWDTLQFRSICAPSCASAQSTSFRVWFCSEQTQTAAFSPVSSWVLILTYIWHSPDEVSTNPLSPPHPFPHINSLIIRFRPSCFPSINISSSGQTKVQSSSLQTDQAKLCVLTLLLLHMRDGLLGCQLFRGPVGWTGGHTDNIRLYIHLTFTQQT